MSLRLRLQDGISRTVTIVGATHALTFDCSSQESRQAPLKCEDSSFTTVSCAVTFSAAEKVQKNGNIQINSVHGILGLINIGCDTFLCIITRSLNVAFTKPGESISRILAVDFICINSARFDNLDGQKVVQDLDERPALFGPGSGSQGINTTEDIHPCSELKNLLASGTFYYSLDVDLTNRAQQRLKVLGGLHVDNLNTEFLWNQFMLEPIFRFRNGQSTSIKASFDSCNFLIPIIRGFASTMLNKSLVTTAEPQISNASHMLTLLSRLSCRRTGTRFNARGIDDDGYVANSVETEVLLWQRSGHCYSHVQIRGSMPLFWEQSSVLIPGQQKIQIARPKQATQLAFDKHFDRLCQEYGAVHILNLLSDTRPSEFDLTERLKDHLQPHRQLNALDTEQVRHRELCYSGFDFHAIAKIAGHDLATPLLPIIDGDLAKHDYFWFKVSQTSGSRSPEIQVFRQQAGVWRTNCLDCLDRTNQAQSILSWRIIGMYMLETRSLNSTDISHEHANMWADNGDSLSKIYAGTGALKSSLTRHGKLSLSGALADARKSATRLYMSNFVDKSRQNTTDLLLGRLYGQTSVRLFDPINDHVNLELSKKLAEYETTEKIQIWVGTFNVNGKSNATCHDLSAWLHSRSQEDSGPPKIIAVGFQEIVDLTPQQIVATSSEPRLAWENAVTSTINKYSSTAESHEYILLRSGQLVGALLLVYVQREVLHKIKNVEGSVKKTGLSGIAGNKGAVAIRLDYSNSRLCFVTAHFAAGFANYEDRNRDYRTISQDLRFQRNHSIEDNDAIFWLGDFNYRIQMSNDEVRRHITAGDLEALYQNDQLHLQMVDGHVFRFYSEAKLLFQPTYKYQNGTDKYDTSDKVRIPAWCDRILYRGSMIQQIAYDTAPLNFSDHRPVFGVFHCVVSEINEMQKKDLGREIYNTMSAQTNLLALARKTDTDQPSHDYCDSSHFPPPSSETHKWWLNEGMLARSEVRPPRGWVLNTRRPDNPFHPTSEPDWNRPTSLGVSRSDLAYQEKNNNGTNMSGQRRQEPHLTPSTNSQLKLAQNAPATEPHKPNTISLGVTEGYSTGEPESPHVPDLLNDELPKLYGLPVLQPGRGSFKQTHGSSINPVHR